LFSCSSRKKKIKSLENRIYELKVKQSDFLINSYLSDKKELVKSANYSNDSLTQIINELETEVNRLKEQGGIKISIDY
jgi:arsenate reductase-like glutaredoxin family protein